MHTFSTIRLIVRGASQKNLRGVAPTTWARVKLQVIPAILSAGKNTRATSVCPGIERICRDIIRNGNTIKILLNNMEASNHVSLMLSIMFKHYFNVNSVISDYSNFWEQLKTLAYLLVIVLFLDSICSIDQVILKTPASFLLEFREYSGFIRFEMRTLWNTKRKTRKIGLLFYRPCISFVHDTKRQYIKLTLDCILHNPEKVEDKTIDTLLLEVCRQFLCIDVGKEAVKSS